MGRLISGSTNFLSRRFSVMNPDDNVLYRSNVGDLDRFAYTGNNFSVASQTGAGLGIFFSSTGEYAFVISTTIIYQYNLTIPWDASTASYSSKSLNFGSLLGISPTSTSLFIDKEGRKLYIIDSGNDRVYECDLITPWDITTAKSVVREYTATAQIAAQTAQGVKFGDNGTKLYILSSTTTDVVYQYTLSTPWDVSTASYASKSLTVSAQDSDVLDISFSSDGTKLYTTGNTNNTIYQYNLSTAWDISTASYSLKSLSVGSQDTTPTGFVFNDDGTKGYIIGDSNNAIYQYTFTIAWDISTGFYASKSLSVSSQEANPNAIAFKSDGTKVYIVGSSSDQIREYTLSTPWDISTGTYSQGFNISVYESSSRGFDISSDGRTFIICGVISLSVSKVYGFTARNAWDVSTLHQGYVSVGSQDSTPEDIWFKPDGTKMFILGGATAPLSIYQYSLSSPWDTSTATYDSVSLNVSGVDGSPKGITFNYTGTVLYLLGSSNDRVYQYNLPTPWSLSGVGAAVTKYSLYYIGSSSFFAEGTPKGIYLNETEDRLYIFGDTSDRVYQFNCLF